MMLFNWLFLPTLLCAGVLWLAGVRIASSVRSPAGLGAWFVLSALLALPALLFVAYYAHVLDNAAWFYAFRAAPGTELCAAGLGLGAGLLAELLRRRSSPTHQARANLLAAGVALMGVAVLFVPYAKPVLAPMRAPIQDKWSGGVCLQTSPSTCGPSSAATLLRAAGVSTTEGELARECFSYRGGTENWYVARALARHGLQAHYLISAPDPPVLPLPSMAGVQMGGALVSGVQGPTPGRGGHFITVLGRAGDSYIIGDPLVGRLVLTPGQLRTRYYFTGFFLVATRPS